MKTYWGEVRDEKVFKNISLKLSIIALAVVSLVIIYLVAFTGYKGITDINSNLDAIYQDAVLPVQEMTEINSEFMAIRVETLRMFELGYTPSIVKNVEKMDKDLRNMIEECLEGNMILKKDVAVFEIAYKKYDEFMVAWDAAKQVLLNEEVIDSNLKFKMDASSNTFMNNMQHIIHSSKNQVDIVKNESTIIYENSKNSIIMIAGISLILLLFVAIMITGVFRSSIKEITDIFETIATGNLQVQIDTKSKNEFGLIKKSLAKTIEEFAFILRKSKENSTNTAENAQSLAAISQQMTAVADEVSNAIQEVAQGSSGQSEELKSIKAIIDDFSIEIDNIVASVEEIHSNTKDTDALVTIGNEKLQDLTTSTDYISKSFTDVSNNVAIVLSELNKNPRQRILDLYSNVKKNNNMSFSVFVLSLDWLYLIDAAEIDGKGVIRKCS